MARKPRNEEDASTVLTASTHPSAPAPSDSSVVRSEIARLRGRLAARTARPCACADSLPEEVRFVLASVTRRERTLGGAYRAHVASGRTGGDRGAVERAVAVGVTPPSDDSGGSRIPGAGAPPGEARSVYDAEARDHDDDRAEGGGAGGGRSARWRRPSSVPPGAKASRLHRTARSTEDTEARDRDDIAEDGGAGGRSAKRRPSSVPPGMKAARLHRTAKSIWAGRISDVAPTATAAPPEGDGARPDGGESLSSEPAAVALRRRRRQMRRDGDESSARSARTVPAEMYASGGRGDGGGAPSEPKRGGDVRSDGGRSERARTARWRRSGRAAEEPPPRMRPSGGEDDDGCVRRRHASYPSPAASADRRGRRGAAAAAKARRSLVGADDIRPPQLDPSRWTFEMSERSIVLARRGDREDDGDGEDDDERRGARTTTTATAEMISLSDRTIKVDNTEAGARVAAARRCGRRFAAQFAPAIDFSGGRVWEMIESAKRNRRPGTGELEDRNVVYISYSIGDEPEDELDDGGDDDDDADEKMLRTLLTARLIGTLEGSEDCVLSRPIGSGARRLPPGRRSDPRSDDGKMERGDFGAAAAARRRSSRGPKEGEAPSPRSSDPIVARRGRPQLIGGPGGTRPRKSRHRSADASMDAAQRLLKEAVIASRPEVRPLGVAKESPGFDGRPSAYVPTNISEAILKKNRAATRLKEAVIASHPEVRPLGVAEESPGFDGGPSACVPTNIFIPKKSKAARRRRELETLQEEEGGCYDLQRPAASGSSVRVLMGAKEHQEHNEKSHKTSSYPPRALAVDAGGKKDAQQQKYLMIQEPMCRAFQAPCA